MTATLEREIKLPFESAEAARAAVLATGATPLHGRRLQEDCLLDTTNDDLRRRRSALRVRQDGGRSILTFKGPVQPAVGEGPRGARDDRDRRLAPDADSGSARLPRLVPLREIPRGVLARRLHHRDRRDAGRRLRGNRRRRPASRRRRRCSAAAPATTCSTPTAASSSATASSSASSRPTCCSTTTTTDV